MNTTTQTATNDLRHTIDINNDQVNGVIKIRLSDECKNGHQDFSLTATFWEVGKARNDRNMTKGGCCHDEILKHRPDLQIFANLHLCDFLGIPMHAVENGFYFLGHGFSNTPTTSENFKSEFCEYYRITPQQFDVLNQCENKLRYSLHLEKLGILEQWKSEADKAIYLLEELTGKKFLIDSPRTHIVRPTAEEIAAEDAKDAEGYYKPGNVQKRKAQAEADAKTAQYKAIEDDMNKTIDKAKKEHEVKKAVLDAGYSLENFIFYNHSNTGSFNWLDYKPRLTQTQFEEFLKVVKIDGVKFECK